MQYCYENKWRNCIKCSCLRNVRIILCICDMNQWFSLSKEGANNEMISAKRFSYKNLRSLKWRSIRKSRFFLSLYLICWYTLKYCKENNMYKYLQVPKSGKDVWYFKSQYPYQDKNSIFISRDNLWCLSSVQILWSKKGFKWTSTRQFEIQNSKWYKKCLYRWADRWGVDGDWIE